MTPWRESRGIVLCNPSSGEVDCWTCAPRFFGVRLVLLKFSYINIQSGTLARLLGPVATGRTRVPPQFDFRAGRGKFSSRACSDHCLGFHSNDRFNPLFPKLSVCFDVYLILRRLESFSPCKLNLVMHDSCPNLSPDGLIAFSKCGAFLVPALLANKCDVNHFEKHLPPPHCREINSFLAVYSFLKYLTPLHSGAAFPSPLLLHLRLIRTYTIPGREYKN